MTTEQQTSAEKPAMTIVVPVHNRASIVDRTLRSIHGQTYRPLHVILVDNNSTDNSLQRLEQWKSEVDAPDFSVRVLSESTPGAPAARNRGLSEVTTDYLMFFDSDDIMLPTHVERAMQALLAHPHPDIVGWNVHITTVGGKSFSKPFYATDTIWHCIMHGSMGTQRYAARTELFRKAGYWNPAIPGWNDIELGARMLMLNPSIRKLTGPTTVRIFQQTVSITGLDFSSTPWKWETSLNAIEHTLRHSPRMRRYVNLRRALLAGDYAREGNRQESDRLLRTATGNESSPFHRMLFRIIRRYVAAGGRGGARLLRPFF